MKNIAYCIAIISFALLQISSLFAQQSDRFFYYYQGKETRMEVNTEQILVKFADDVNKEQKTRIIAQHPLLDASYIKEMAGVSVVNVWPKSSKRELLASLTELQALSTIVYAHPFLEVSGTDMPLSYQDDIVVQLVETASATRLEELAAAYGLRIASVIHESMRLYQLELSATASGDAIDMANRFHQLAEIEFAEPNFFGGHAGNYVPNDPLVSSQYSLDNNGAIPNVGGVFGASMRVLDAWDITTGCADITIAILDDGVDLNHPDLSPNLVPGFDALGLNNTGMRWPGETHGTACAGTAAAKGDNGIGVAGVAYDCSIMPVRVFSDTFGNTSVNFAQGFIWATDNGADVLSNSWGWGQSNLIDLGIFYATTFGRNGRGCIVLASSGNSNNSTVGYPARNPQVIAVGASNMCDERKRTHSSQSWLDDTLNCSRSANADPQGVSCDLDSCWGSSFGIDQEIVAPGVMVRTTFENGGYGWFRGTSASCPNAAGVAALILSVNPELFGFQVREILSSTARKLPGYTFLNVGSKPYGTWNTQVGYGIPHATNAVLEARDGAIVYVQNETLTAPPIADTRTGRYAVLAGRNVTNTKAQGNVNVLAPNAPITVFLGGKKVIIKPGFRANSRFTARISTVNCPVKE